MGLPRWMVVGSSMASWSGLRVEEGSSFTISCSMVRSRLAVLNWTVVVASVTMTVSSRPPTSSLRSTVTSPRCCTRTFFWTTALKPDSSARRE